MKIKKRPGGRDYVVTVRHATEGLFPVTVFGCQSEDDAKRDALSSFDDEDLKFVSVVKIEVAT